MREKTVDEKWQTKFLNAGTEKGLGDLSMMIGVVSEMLQAERQKREEMVEAERERVCSLLDERIALLAMTIKQTAVTDKKNYLAARNALIDFQSEVKALTQPNN